MFVYLLTYLPLPYIGLLCSSIAVRRRAAPCHREPQPSHAMPLHTISAPYQTPLNFSLAWPCYAPALPYLTRLSFAIALLNSTPLCSANALLNYANAVLHFAFAAICHALPLLSPTMPQLLSANQCLCFTPRSNAHAVPTKQSLRMPMHSTLLRSFTGPCLTLPQPIFVVRN